MNIAPMLIQNVPQFETTRPITILAGFSPVRPSDICKLFVPCLKRQQASYMHRTKSTMTMSFNPCPSPELWRTLSSRYCFSKFKQTSLFWLSDTNQNWTSLLATSWCTVNTQCNEDIGVGGVCIVQGGIWIQCCKIFCARQPFFAPLGIVGIWNQDLQVTSAFPVKSHLKASAAKKNCNNNDNGYAYK